MKFSSSFLKVSQNRNLVNYKIEFENEPAKKQKTNHIWIYDRSGSMHRLLDGLIEDLIVRSRQLPLGDTITFGWFSSEGERNFIIKGFKISEESDYSLLENILRQNNTTLGMTCFSEILSDTHQVVQDLSVFTDRFSLMFFTDGYPVVSDYGHEISSIYKAISRLSGHIANALLVGYGHYYNKTLMADMAEKLNGSLTHSSDLPSFFIALDSFVTNSEKSSKLFLTLDETITKDTLVYSVNGSTINLHAPNPRNEIQISASGDFIDVFVLTDSPTDKSEKLEIDDSFAKGLYAGAYVLTQRTKTDSALDMLGLLGDKKLIDAVTNAYTNDEYGRAEKSLQEAVGDPSKRYQDGKVDNYIPPTDAFCLLDLIELLANDPNAYFYPRHKDFEYKLVGRKSRPLAEYPEFNADVSSRASFRDIVWHDSKINLSLRAVISGSVDLGDEARKYGLLKEYPTFQHRNYTFVKDGVLNISKVPASFSEELFKTLIHAGVVELSDPMERLLWEDGKIYILNLDKIPIVNRKIAASNLSARDLCEKVIAVHELKGVVKALKWHKKTHFEKDEVTAETATTFLEKQQAFLESKGINTKTGAFEPKTETLESTDFYLAKEFEIKVKGLSSLPKVEAVIEKMKAGKKLTASDKVVAAGVAAVEAHGNVYDHAMEKWLTEEIETKQKEIKSIQRQIQNVKFALLLGKMWFSEFSSRDDNKVALGDYEVSFRLSEKRVDI